MKKTFVEVITDFEAIHNWPECPYEEVSFLKYPHRHKIIVSVLIETTDDRQIEFFMLKKKVDESIKEMYGDYFIKDLGRKSMEEISNNILDRLLNEYGHERKYIISASEDGQVRGIVEYEKKER